MSELGRRMSWPILRCYIGIRLTSMTATMNSPSQDDGFTSQVAFCNEKFLCYEANGTACL